MNSDIEHAKRIALPSRIGQYIGKQVWGEPYIVFPFIQYAEQRIIEAIMDTSHERYIIINAPPQVGKSSYVGILLPFWITGMFPAWQVMYISYSDDFSLGRGKDVRSLHQLYGKELFNSAIDPDFTSASDWRVSGGRGGMLSVGIGAQITGRPGHCFPGDTLVSTPIGPQRIDELARHGGTVWGYDHSTNHPVERRVTAGAAKGCKPLVEIQFTSGRSITCTDDHPIFIAGRGYTPAGLVEVGSKARAVRDGALRAVWAAGDDAGVRAGQEAAHPQWQGVLRSGVRGEQPSDGLQSTMCSLWSSGTEGAAVLLADMPDGRSPRIESDEALPDVWSVVHPEVVTPAVLLAGVRERSPLVEDAREEQPALQDRHVVQPVVSDGAIPGSGARRLALRRLLLAGRFGRPSHRRQPGGQYGHQPGDPVSRGSHATPQVEDDTVSLVRPVRGGGVVVYDIQVEDTGNFFAGEVLVHNCIIIDDLIKNSQEATSAATKKLHLTEWDGTINRRIQPGGTVIMIATRWAEDDLSGALIDRMNEPGYTGPQWEVIEYPAFAEPVDGVELTDDELLEWTDQTGRHHGEVLDCRFSRIPDRAPEDFFTLAKAGMDPFAWSCLYQQKPSAREGGMFPPDNWQFYDPNELPSLDREVRVWDLAATEGGGDWSVGTKIGRAGDKFYITDVRRFRKNSGGVQDEVKLVATLDGYSPKILIEEEKGGAGKSVIESYKRLLVGHTIEAAKAEGDKESRATPYSAEQHKRRVFVPRPGTVSWDVKAFIEEHRKMMGDGRRPKHDDQIDTAAYGMLELLGSGIVEMWVPNGRNWPSPEAQMNVMTGRNPYF